MSNALVIAAGVMCAVWIPIDLAAGRYWLVALSVIGVALAIASFVIPSPAREGD